MSDIDDDLLALTHTGDEYEKYLGAVVPPVFLNSLHVFKDFGDFVRNDPDEERFVYGRVSNPTVTIAEKKIAQLEHGARAAVFSSGMAAATAAIMATCGAGSHIICMRDAYPPVKRFLNGFLVPKLNMSVTYVAGTDLSELEGAIKPETSLIILESPASIVFTIPDIAAITAIAKRHGIKTYIDNTYCTPLFQKPLEMGIDIVMHTLSKYMGGHSDIIGGVLVSKDDALMRRITSEMREWFGGILGPMEGWLLIRGLRTLSVRLRQHQETAMEIANYLEKHPKIRRVLYTGLPSHPQADIIARQQSGHTGLLSFIPDAPPEASVRFINALRLFGKGVSWGGFESLAIVPIYMASDEELEFLSMRDGRGLIRIHCGLEGAANLLADLEQAFTVL